VKTEKKFESMTFSGQEVTIKLRPAYQEEISGKISKSEFIDLLKVEVTLKKLQPTVVIDLAEAIKKAETINLVAAKFILEVKFWKTTNTPDFYCKILSVKRRRKNE